MLLRPIISLTRLPKMLSCRGPAVDRRDAAHLQLLTPTGRPHEDTQEVDHLFASFLTQPADDGSRYSEFEDLHAKLLQTFPHAAGSLPQFPPKSVICKSFARTPPHPTSPTNVCAIARFRPRFLEKRKQGLSYFLKFVGIDNSH